MDRGGSSYYYVADGLGSIVKLVDAAGAVVNNYVYDSFGNMVEKTEGVANPYTYTAREYDAESGLYYYRARYYDANSGRFLSEDPLKFCGEDINLYRYVKNDPISWYDPWGLIRLKEGINDDLVKDKIKDKYDIIDDVYSKNNAPEAVITETYQSRKHKKGSKHYTGEAIDLRGKNVTDEKMKKLSKDLQETLGPDYDVVPEYYPDDPINDHIHLEYDPKPKDKNCP